MMQFEPTKDPAADILLSFYEFGIPRTPKTKDKTIKYHEIIGGNLKEEVVAMLKTGTQQRRLLVQGLTYAGTTPNPQNVIGSVNAYLPSVWKIQKSLQASKDTLIKLQKPLLFTWHSVLTPPGEDNTLTQSVFIFEVSMIIVVRALSHYNAAQIEVQRALQNQNNVSNMNAMFKNAVTELRNGAGVLDFVAKYLQNWKKPPKNPLPEVNRRILVGLQNYFLCQAQRILTAKAIMDKQYVIVPQLLGGLQQRYSTCINYLKSGQQIVPDIVQECVLMVHVCESFAHRYAASNLRDKIDSGKIVDDLETNFGNSVAHVIVANSKFNINWSGLGNIRKRYEGKCSQVKQILVEMETEFQETNAGVYFGPVDMEEATLPTRSQHKFLPQPIEFNVPAVEALSFQQVPRAPPGIEQKAFEQMPVDIQNELWAQHNATVEAAKAAELEAKNGAKKSKKKKKKGKEPELPPGYDRATFNELPPDLQKEILAEYQRNK
uniref:BRO1 domain-containing protein n=2 Tax=Aplanochytrium stocchinoi TaxID=215587 RepID=A0A7S3LID4_9STRA|mmetsp:Transcript_23041/g.28284  ORF Transcript_23041/g.28284 Transcript_23041/m.28284 type:complete len:490 (+) Transcript_23041:113-1582(+)|eukprot:CAMPEP_0204827590 /NCGR_PEP_ID=MMETSP1346-20131115/5026_1 /ASSEMBLY_ACC=CAM_ASM_000771 /TAXON_ID=215587 /ORGANISM="Aplanochytrium stocchinoi, Strain GSBS06" /LENGTH=489 /DNA_ID=CAMNT_0051956083 /DNA_START=95 /DNA_END=1564 /DNA_ORIENTATION=+